MDSDSGKKYFFDSFPPSSKKDWILVASKELADADPLEKLKKTNQGLVIYPYYDISDHVNTPFQLPVSTDRHKANRAWENLSIVHLGESSLANQEALRALQSGADGILFSLDLALFSESILKNIQWQHCSLRFFAKKGQEKFFLALGEFASAQNLNPNELQGSVFWKNDPDDTITIMHAFQNFKSFHCCGILLEENESKQEMIADALLRAVRFIEIAIQNGIPFSQVVHQLAFSVPVGTDFFLEIAVLKTVRRLWYQICMAYDPLYSSLLHLHAYSNAFTKQQFQSHANLIKSSTAALAAVVGGCDSLSVESEDPKNITLSRIARNVSSVLLEESHLGLVADPTAGSYYIENLTDQLARSSWELFQKRAAS